MPRLRALGPTVYDDSPHEVETARRALRDTARRAVQTLTLWREGKGEVHVFAAPAARVAGTLGLREKAAVD